MTQLTHTEAPIEIERSPTGSLLPTNNTNNGVVVNYYRDSTGASPAPMASASSLSILPVVAGLLCVVVGMLLAQGLGGLRNAQLTRQNALLAQQIAQQSAQIEGVKSLVCGH